MHHDACFGHKRALAAEVATDADVATSQRESRIYKLDALYKSSIGSTPCNQALRRWYLVSNKATTLYQNFRCLSYRNTAPSNTCVPTALCSTSASARSTRGLTYQSSGLQYSSGLWLTPSLVTAKTMLVGHRRFV